MRFLAHKAPKTVVVVSGELRSAYWTTHNAPPASAKARYAPWQLALVIVSTVLALSSAPLAAPEVKVFAAVSQSEMGIADRFTYTVKVEHPLPGEADLPGLVGNLGSFEVKSVETRDSAIGKDRNVRIWTASLSAYVTGEFPIPAQEVVYRAAKADSNAPVDSVVLATSPIVIKILPRIDSTMSDILDAEPPMESPSWPWWAYALLGWAYAIIVAGIIALILFIIGDKKKKKEIPLLPPHLEALGALQSLRSQGVPETAQAEYFDALSFILRRYLNRRFAVDALEATTSELVERLQGASYLGGGKYEEVCQFLRQSDLVRFAKFDLPVDECKGFLEMIDALVRATVPSLAEGEGGGGQTPGSGQSQGGAPPSQNNGNASDGSVVRNESVVRNDQGGQP